MTDHASTLERLGTGSTALDAILGGGIPAGSVTVVAGEPGSGKTVFTLQTLFHHARQGKKCLYFATLSEPALKVIRYMQLFSFFDARLSRSASSSPISARPSAAAASSGRWRS